MCTANVFDQLRRAYPLRESRNDASRREIYRLSPVCQCGKCKITCLVEGIYCNRECKRIYKSGKLKAYDATNWQTGMSTAAFTFSTRRKGVGNLRENWIEVLYQRDILGHILAKLCILDLCRFARTCRASAIAVASDLCWFDMLRVVVPPQKLDLSTDSPDAQSGPQKMTNLEQKLTSAEQKTRFAPIIAPERESASLVNVSDNKLVLEPASKVWAKILECKQSIPTDAALFSFTSLPNRRETAQYIVAWLWITLQPHLKCLPRLPGFSVPQEQARLLANLTRFVAIDVYGEHTNANIELVAKTVQVFEIACLDQFDICRSSSSRTAKYFVDALIELKSGKRCCDHYLNSVKSDTNREVDPLLCLIVSNESLFNPEPLCVFLHQTYIYLKKELEFIHQVFPDYMKVDLDLLDKLIRPEMPEFVSIIYENIENEDIYFFAIVETFALCIHFGKVLKSYTNSEEMYLSFNRVLYDIFDQHQDFFLYKVESVFKRITGILSKKDNCSESYCEQDIKLTQFIELAHKKNGSCAKPQDPKTSLIKRDLLQHYISFVTKPVPLLDKSSFEFNKSQDCEYQQEFKNLLQSFSQTKSMFSLEVIFTIIVNSKDLIHKARLFLSYQNTKKSYVDKTCEKIFHLMLDAIYYKHMKLIFEQSRTEFVILDNNNIHTSDFFEMTKAADFVQEMVDAFYRQEIKPFLDVTDFTNQTVKHKTEFEKAIDDDVAKGLNALIMLMMEQVDKVLVQTQKVEDFRPQVLAREQEFGPTDAAKTAIKFLKNKTDAIVHFADKNITDVFFHELGLRLFHVITNHIKRYKISTEGATRLISDINMFYDYIATFKQAELRNSYSALKELGGLFLMDAKYAKAIGQILGDTARFSNLFKPEDLYAFAQCRTDWIKIRKQVDKFTYGFQSEDCILT